MSLTETIEAELLHTLQGSGEPGEVIARYSGSKGPLYSALARATARGSVELARIRQQLAEARHRLAEAQRDTAAAESKGHKAQDVAAAAEARLRDLAGGVGHAERILQQAEALRALGCDGETMAAIGRLVAAVADGEGIPPAQAVPHLLEAGEHHGRLVDFEAQAVAAERRLQRAQSELTRLTPAIQALREEREALKAGLAAIAADGTSQLAKAQQVAVTAVQKVQRAAELVVQQAGAAAQAQARAAEQAAERSLAGYRRLTREAALLEQDVTFARLLRDPDAGYWQVVAPSSWQVVLTRLAAWAGAVTPDLPVPIPEPVKGVVAGSVSYPAVYGPLRVPLLGLIAWLSEGIKLVPSAALRAHLDRVAAEPERSREN